MVDEPRPQQTEIPVVWAAAVMVALWDTAGGCAALTLAPRTARC